MWRCPLPKCWSYIKPNDKAHILSYAIYVHYLHHAATLSFCYMPFNFFFFPIFLICNNTISCLAILCHCYVTSHSFPLLHPISFVTPHFRRRAYFLCMPLTISFLKSYSIVFVSFYFSGNNAYEIQTDWQGDNFN